MHGQEQLERLAGQECEANCVVELSVEGTFATAEGFSFVLSAERSDDEMQAGEALSSDAFVVSGEGLLEPGADLGRVSSASRNTAQSASFSVMISCVWMTSSAACSAWPSANSDRLLPIRT
jgi:hypothetical protein